MTIEQLIEHLGSSPAAVAAVLLATPALAWLLLAAHGAGRGDLRPWRYAHAVLLHLAVLPGMLALLLLGYQLAVHPERLLSLDLLVYVLPPLAMALALAGIRRATAFERLPGAGRLRGLATAAAASFAIALLFLKTGVRLFFLGSAWAFLACAVLLYVLLRGGLRVIAGRRRHTP